MAVISKSGFAASSVADNLITNCMVFTGARHWVDSASGNDANDGSEGEPLATIAQAVTNATDNNGDIVIVKSGHTETLTTAITVDCPGLMIFGIGSGSDAPQITVNAAIDGFDITADDVILNNIHFPVGTTANNTSRVNVSGDGVLLKDLTFLCGQYDLESITLATGANNCRIESCSFTVSADGPDAGIEIEAAITGLYLKSCSFDGGSSNWDTAGINSGVAHLNYRYEDLTLTNDADIIHSNSGNKGLIANTTEGDGSSVQV